MAATVDKDKAAKDLATRDAVRGPLKHVAWTDPMGVRLPDVRYKFAITHCGDCGNPTTLWVTRLYSRADMDISQNPVMPLCLDCLVRNGNWLPSTKERAEIASTLRELAGSMMYLWNRWKDA